MDPTAAPINVNSKLNDIKCRIETIFKDFTIIKHNNKLRLPNSDAETTIYLIDKDKTILDEIIRDIDNIRNSFKQNTQEESENE